jgi:surface carbohydrate biosynthesis protein
MKIKFLTYKKKKIIFDYDTGLNLIKFLSLKKKDFFIFKTYPDTLYFSLEIVINFIKLLLNNSKYKNINKLGFLNFIYLISFFKTFNPKSILTYLDNSLIVSTIVYNFPNIKIISIQNGVRPKFLLDNYKLFLDNYYSFSQSEKKLLSTNNSKFRKLIPIGSMPSKYYYPKHKNKKKEFDLCLVCQLPGAIDQIDITPKYNQKTQNQLKFRVKKSIDKMNLYLSKYCKEKNLKIAICLRDKDETLKLNYQNLFTKNCKIFEMGSKKINKGKTYEIMAKSKIIVGFNTTCVRESWGFSKAIYIDYTGTKLFNEICNNEMLIIRNQSYSYLKNKLDYLLSLNKPTYEKKIKKYSKNYMDKKSIKLIKQEILERLN